MPYKRKGKSVYKKNGEKVGTSSTVEGAKKYLKALYANADKPKSKQTRRKR